MEHVVKILAVTYITHDVKRFLVEKPQGYEFVPGQATAVSINKPKLQDEKRPFTFTSLPNDKHLELVIKIYDDHDGVTRELDLLKADDELIIGPSWGAIQYKGPGYFIAGGAGVTPFISIIRHLHKQGELKDNKLFFANKTSRDIILQDELQRYLGSNMLNILSREDSDEFPTGRIDKAFLKEQVDDFSKQFYVCGPPQMVEDVNKALKELGASPESVVFEE